MFLLPKWPPVKRCVEERESGRRGTMGRKEKEEEEEGRALRENPVQPKEKLGQAQGLGITDHVL